MENATKNLCQRIVGIGFDDLSLAAIERTRQLFLDGLAVAVAGVRQERPPAILAAHAKEMGGVARASVIGFGFKTSPVLAASVNGASMHVLDFEPMWSPANHQLSTSLPVILALAETTDCDGRAAATALVKGIEMMGWLCQASGQFMPSAMTFHQPGLVGPMGAAVVAGHILGLDAATLANALAIAGSRSGSLLANAGTDTKSTHCGFACASGLDAAFLAKRGFTGNADILEADRGYVDNFFGLERFGFADLDRYGTPFRIVEPGYAIKMFPSQFATHFVITAALELHRKIDDSDRITAIRLTTPTMAYIDRPKPATGLAGKFSWQYTAVAALLDGTVGVTTFEDAWRHRPAVDTLLGLVTLEMRDDIPARFEEMYIELEVDLAIGATLKTRCDGPKGKWGTPPISMADHLAKVRGCLDLGLAPAERDRIIELGGHFEQLSNAELREIMDLLRNGRGR